MKKLFLLFSVILISVIGQAQVKVKGIELGVVIPRNNHEYYWNGESYIESTLGGVTGRLVICRINNKKVFSIKFYPTTGFTPDNTEFCIEYYKNKSFKVTITNSIFKSLLRGIEKNYEIKFNKKVKDSYRYTLEAKKNGVSYVCNVEYSKIMNYPYKPDNNSILFTFSVTNILLQQINEHEKTERINSDF